MNTSPIQDKVLASIKSGHVHMRPRAFFIARVLALVAVVVAVFLVSIFFVSFVFFALQESGQTSLLGFGARGFGIFFSIFPWVIVGSILVLLILLELLLRTFRFGYRIPVLRVLIGVVVLTVLAGAAVALTPLHSLLLEQADNDNLPVIGGLYGSVHESHKDIGVFRGTVISVATSSFMFSHDDRDRDTDDGTWAVIPPPGMSLGTVHVGDKVYVAGDAVNGVIRSYGIQILRSGE